MKRKFMDLNRETALRLWNKTFGKETKVVDFANRRIVKGAYGDRKSEYGWNVDHILPVSQGGKTNDSNLIITHIKTNDEKADKFPCFVANGIKFKIVKVQNHYEIKSAESVTVKKAEDDSKTNYYDAAAGVRLFKKLKGIQNKPRFVGSVLIRLKNIQNTAVVDFIEKFLDEENISYSLQSNFDSSETRIIAKNYNMPLKEDVDTLLDKCVLLNTYLSCYFHDRDYIEGYEIWYRVDYYKEKTDMYLDSQKIDLMKGNIPNWYGFKYNEYENNLLINNVVVINSEASEKVESPSNGEWVVYNYIIKELAKDLKKGGKQITASA